jgi:hypothetical protein
MQISAPVITRWGKRVPPTEAYLPTSLWSADQPPSFRHNDGTQPPELVKAQPNDNEIYQTPDINEF